MACSGTGNERQSKTTRCTREKPLAIQVRGEGGGGGGSHMRLFVRLFVGGQHECSHKNTIDWFEPNVCSVCQLKHHLKTTKTKLLDNPRMSDPLPQWVLLIFIGLLHSMRYTAMGWLSMKGWDQASKASFSGGRANQFDSCTIGK